MYAHKRSVLSLFSGVGGLDLGLERAGLQIDDVVENWAPAQAVLAERFPGANLHPDVATFFPERTYFALAAGFPCVDISQVGAQKGLAGKRSGLVSHVFRIADSAKPEWIVLENVEHLLRIGRGAAMTSITSELSARGYSWAYRVVDSRFTGVPQRRRRVVLLASIVPGAAERLLVDGDAEAPVSKANAEESYGFYWTEGRTGTGLVSGAVPTIKAGSTVGLGSAPAVFVPNRVGLNRIVVPSVEALEVLQGFPAGWTEVAAMADGDRTRMIGNAVSVGVGEWLGELLVSEPDSQVALDRRGPIDIREPWPRAGFGNESVAWASEATDRPHKTSPELSLPEILDQYGSEPLSYRAARGCLSRLSSRPAPSTTRLREALQLHLREWAPGATEQESLALNRRRGASALREYAAAIRSQGRRAAFDMTTPTTEEHWADVLCPETRISVTFSACELACSDNEQGHGAARKRATSQTKSSMLPDPTRGASDWTHISVCGCSRETRKKLTIDSRVGT